MSTDATSDRAMYEPLRKTDAADPWWWSADFDVRAALTEAQARIAHNGGPAVDAKCTWKMSRLTLKAVIRRMCGELWDEATDVTLLGQRVVINPLLPDGEIVYSADADPKPLTIKRFPHPALRQVASPIAEITPEIRVLAAAMVRTMIAHDGIGLAANQVGHLCRMFVAHVRASKSTPSMPGRANCTLEPTVYINPRITATSGKNVGRGEGCLSQPGRYVVVKRQELATIEYTDLEGVLRHTQGYGMLARVWQHEIDHLNGINIGVRR